MHTPLSLMQNPAPKDVSSILQFSGVFVFHSLVGNFRSKRCEKGRHVENEMEMLFKNLHMIIGCDNGACESNSHSKLVAQPSSPFIMHASGDLKLTELQQVEKTTLNRSDGL